MQIRKRTYKSGAVAWQLDLGLVDGRRYQRAFAKKSEAENHAAEVLKERREFGDVATRMGHEQRLRYAAAEVRLQRAGVTLEQAVTWAEGRSTAVKWPKTLAEVKALFLADRERGGARERYVRQLGVSLGSFVRGRENLLAHEVTREGVDAWLFGNGWAAGTQKNYLGDLSAMFAWAIVQRFAAVNPCAEVKPAKAGDEGEIEILRPEEIERLLATAVFAKLRVFDRKVREYVERFAFRDLLGYVALAVFCGVRPEEVKRSGTAALDVAHGVFVVGGAVAKTGKRRVVDLPAAAVAWIELWRALGGEGERIVPRNFRKRWDALRELAGLKPGPHVPAGVTPLLAWPHDALRHTASTMHYALHANAAALKAQLGHVQDEETLHQHYRAVRMSDGQPVTKAVAKKFYAIVPTAAMRALTRPAPRLSSPS